jgi:recombination protein RecT
MSAIVTTKKDDVKSLVIRMESQIKRALPAHMTAERFTRIALTELSTTPKLMECTTASFLGSLMQAAQLGLEVGKSLGHSYLIPFNNSKKGITECQFMIGYKGMIDLARRSGQVISLSAHEVYENDEFEYEYGLDEKLYHKPSLTERGEIKCFYAVAKLVGGGHQFEVMSVADINKIKARSKTASFGPWVTDYVEMAKKSVIRKLFKYLPVSVEMQRAVALDEAAERGEQGEIMENVFIDSADEILIDSDGVVIESTGEEHLRSAADKLADKMEKA